MKKYVDGKYIDLSDDEVEMIEKGQNEYLSRLSYDELVNQKIRERYTESQEFSILRQKDEKPDEYRRYYEYCEECKNLVKKLKSQIEM